MNYIYEEDIIMGKVKVIIMIVMVFLLLVCNSNAGTFTSYEAATEITTDDLLLITDAPGTTPTTKRITAGNLFGTFTGSLGATDTRLTKGWFTDLEITNAPTGNGTALTSIFQPLDEDLTEIAGLSVAEGNFIIGSSAPAWSLSSYKLPTTVCTTGYPLVSDGTDIVCGSGALKAWPAGVGKIIWNDGSNNPTTTGVSTSPNYFYAGPVSGEAVEPAFRQITPEDIALKNGNLSGGYFTVYEDSDNGTDYIKVQAPSALSTSPTVYLPQATTGDTLAYGSAPIRFNTGGTTARTITLPDAAITSPVEDRLVAYFYGGGTTAVSAGAKTILTVPFPCVITGGQILAAKALGTSGTVSAVVDIWREATPADFDGASSHPAVTDTIIGGEGTKPTVTTANRAGISVTGWGTTTLAKGDILVFNVDSVTDAVNIIVTLYVSRR